MHATTPIFIYIEVFTAACMTSLCLKYHSPLNIIPPCTRTLSFSIYHTRISSCIHFFVHSLSGAYNNCKDTQIRMALKWRCVVSRIARCHSLNNSHIWKLMHFQYFLSIMALWWSNEGNKKSRTTTNGYAIKFTQARQLSRSWKSVPSKLCINSYKLNLKKHHPGNKLQSQCFLTFMKTAFLPAQCWWVNKEMLYQKEKNW